MKKGQFDTSSRQEDFSAFHHLSPFTPSSDENAARQKFVDDIKTAIGDLDNTLLPEGIQSALQQLLTAGDIYLKDGNEFVFLPYCEHAIEVCGQGWSHLSHWAATEQTLCYTLYWSLKAAVEKHQG